MLFDTWFSNPKQIAAVKELKMDVIAMVKKTGKIHYRYGGEMLDIKQIYARNKKRRGRSRYQLSMDVTVISGKQEIPAKIEKIKSKGKVRQLSGGRPSFLTQSRMSGAVGNFLIFPFSAPKKLDELRQILYIP